MNAINRMIEAQIPGVEFMDLKGQPIVSCVEPVAEIVQEVAAAPAAGAAAPAAGPRRSARRACWSRLEAGANMAMEKCFLFCCF